jgi:hypothetical protein
MARKHNFRELKKSYTASTSNGTKTYAFPALYKTIHDLCLRDGTASVKLEHVQEQQFDQAQPYPESGTSRKPLCYIPRGNSFDLWPIPDGSYVMQLRCVIWPTIITATTDSVIFDSDKDDLLVYGMTEELFSLLQMHEDAAVYGAKFKVALKEAILQDGSWPDWNTVGRGFSIPYPPPFPGWDLFTGTVST